MDATASFRPDQYNDFYLYVDGHYGLITDTRPTALVTDSSLAGTSGAYTIQAQNYIAVSDATACVTRVVSEIKSALPEKYRRMMDRVEGEIIVNQASYHQATAHTTFAVSESDSLRVWRNYSGIYETRDINDALYSPADYSSGMTSFSDYTASTGSTTTITFQIGGSTTNKLDKGDVVVVDYTHALPSVPTILKRIALHKSAFEILWQSGLGKDKMPEHITEYRDQADKMLQAIQDGKCGIHEFDNIRMYVETRTATSGGAKGNWGSVRVDRG